MQQQKQKPSALPVPNNLHYVFLYICSEKQFCFYVL